MNKETAALSAHATYEQLLAYIERQQAEITYLRADVERLRAACNECLEHLLEGSVSHGFVSKAFAATERVCLDYPVREPHGAPGLPIHKRPVCTKPKP